MYPLSPALKRQKLDFNPHMDNNHLPPTHILGLPDRDLHGAHTSTASTSNGTLHLENQAQTPATTNIGAEPSASQPLQVKKLSEKGALPTRGSVGAAGYDLYCAHPTTIPARGKALISTAIAIAVPSGTYGRIAPRSGLASKHGLQTGAGVIDSDYRGEVKVLLFNHSDVEFRVDEGDRVAQLILERIATPEVVCVEELGGTVRGGGGFGSTGGFGVGG